MVVKNLLYLICDNNYRDLLLYNLDNFLINASDGVDVCIICPEDFFIPTHYLEKNIFLFKQKDFDHKHTAKFIIHKFDDITKYQNILYIDCDAIIIKNVDKIFECIGVNNSIINGVQEIDDFCTRENDPYFRFSSKSFSSQIEGFNCGTFGFNIKMLDKIHDLFNFCNINKNLSLCDQPLYNEFLINSRLIKNTLSPFVFLQSTSSYYNKINHCDVLNATIIHFLGNAYGGKDINYIQTFINNLKL